MKKLPASLCLAIAAVICVSGQTTDEYNKNEVFVGYSNQQVDRGNYANFNGVESSYVRNVSRYFGVKGDISATYRNDDFEDRLQGSNGTAITVRTESKESLYNFLGGVQVKDNASKKRFKPFGHALAGVAHYRVKFKNSFNNAPSIDINSTSTGFAAAIGGGLDIKINNRFDFRAIQADYNPVRVNGYWGNNFRFGIGLVIK